MEGVCPPFVNIRTTKFIGTISKTWKGNDFYSFRGIRYAKPPIGDLRFKDPIPYEYSEGEYDATKDGHDCHSIYATDPSEDCLFLNVYTKMISSENLKPVIVFIHPGGLYVGSSLSNFIGPEYILEKPIVLVTFNYRLGTLGFLNLGVKEYPGNAGFKDQVMAIKWVNKNIHNFGGNPNNITLMGYSAGGLSICLHLVSPMSKNLFHRAIIMSGSLPPQQKIPFGHQRNLALRQVKVLGCTTIDSENQTEDIVKFLMGKSAKEISSTLRKMFYFGKDNPIYLWLPVIEMDYGQERFLIEEPFLALKNGNFMKVPILIGFTNQEFGQSAYDILTNKTLLDEFNRNFNNLAPICFMYECHPDKDNITKKIHERILQRQLQYQKKYEKNLETIKDSSNSIELIQSQDISINWTHSIQLCNLFSDSILRFGASKFLFEIAKDMNEIYRYKFSYKGRYTNFNGSSSSLLNGAEHMDDLWYLFKMSPSFKISDLEAEITDTMVDFFTNFVCGNESNIEADWKASSGKYAEISNNGLEIKEDDKWFDDQFYTELFGI